ncbi:MAG: FkbM family methyltransferase [Verrucomicrobia bacterium]|nr:FkbM family methyltransferase [Verrucomicrobiota bacterium]
MIKPSKIFFSFIDLSVKIEYLLPQKNLFMNLKDILFFLLAAACLSAASLEEQLSPQIESAAHRWLDPQAEYFATYLEYLKQFPFKNYTVSGDYHHRGSFFIDMWIQGAYKEDVIKGLLEIGGIWEEFMAEHFQRYIRPGSVAIDIGAHIGTHTITMSRCAGPDGYILAFEPQPKISRELFMNLLLNRITNVKLYPIAIGAETGTIELRPLTPKNEGGTCLGGSRTTGQYVPLRPLDDFHLTNVSLIKADIEGMELDFLKGAKQTILNNRPVILIEIAGGECYEFTTPEVKRQIEAIISTLSTYGYKVERAKGPWAACWDYLALPIEEKSGN